MNDELLKMLGTLTVSIGGVWVALHKKLENLSTRLSMAEKNLEKVEHSHRADIAEVKSKIRSAETTLAEIRAQYATTSADIKNLTSLMSELRTDVKTLLSQRGHNGL